MNNKPFLFALILLVSILNLSSCTKEFVSPDNKCGYTYYYFFEDKIPLEKSPTSITLGFKENLSFDQASQIINESGYLEPIMSQNYIVTGQKFVQTKIKGYRTCEDVNRILDYLKENEKISFANQDLYSGQNKKENYLGLTDEFYVGLKNAQDYPILEKFAQEKNVEIVRKSAYSESYSMRVDKFSNYDALEMANIFQESGLFEYAAPDFLAIVQPANSPY